MSTDLVPVSAALLDRIDALGVRVEPVCRRAGLTASRFESSKAHLATREFFAFWRAVEEEAEGARDLGLVLGSQALTHHYSVASRAAIHASNLAEALKTLARYKRLTCPEHVEIEIARG